MTSRRFVALSALVLVTGLLAGCVGEPEPVETTPGFASEEEAFAAAEETYRAYVDALNQVDLSDPETFEPVFAWTTGELNGTDRKSFSAWHASGYAILGSAVVASVELSAGESGTKAEEISVDACYDVSGVDVLDTEGVSMVDGSRPDVQALTISFAQSSATPTGLVVAAIDPAAGEKQC
ncbi:MAG TPA: hypothetical protein VFY91_15135 [Microbacterium sp.]|nr:hypothetical protein [Microbacterium sp.]